MDETQNQKNFIDAMSLQKAVLFVNEKKEKLEVQYNPSTVSISTAAQIKEQDDSAGTQEGNSAKLSSSSRAELRFDLVFENTENAKDQNYVREKAEGILALLTQENRMVIFQYAGMQFYGELQDVKIKYHMFDEDGNPIWADVSVTVREKQEKKQEKETPDASFQPPPETAAESEPAVHEYKELEKEYDKFLTPVTVIKVNGKDIAENKSGFAVSDIEIDLTSGYEASIAIFSIYNTFHKDKGEFRVDEVKKYIFLGSSISISAGYGNIAKNIFRGFIAKVNFLYEEGEIPHIQVTCMDVKGIMMAGSHAKQLVAENYSDAVKEIFQKSVYTKMQSQEIYTGLNISATPDKQNENREKEKQQTIEMVNESDYEFVVRAAKKFNYEFFVDSGTVYFRKAKSVKTVTANLSLGKILKRFDVEYDMTGLVESIQVRGMDTGKMKLIKSKQKSDEKISLGNKAKSLIKNSEKVYIDPTIRSQQDAQYRNEYLLEDMSYRFGTLQCDCQGLPELKPGSFVSVEGLKKPVDNKFYITSVKHIINSEYGFVTKLVAKTASV